MKTNKQSFLAIIRLVIIGGLLSVPPPVHAAAKYANDIYYLCADWGPELEATDTEKADEIIYFIKMIEFRSPSPDEKRPSSRLWFCKMNWDGSNKKEICELWAGQRISVGAEPDTMWMSVCPKAKKAAFSIEYGNQPSWGLWMVDFDGKNLHELARPAWTEKDKRAYVHPGISPNGEEVVFSASQHEPSAHPPTHSRLGIVKVKTGKVRWLTEGPEDDHPDWSLKGDWIVYTHYTYLPNGKKPRRIWLIKPDGSEKKPVMGQISAFSMDIDAKKEMAAWWPTWSTDGRWIWALSGNPCFYIADAQQAKTVLYRDAKHGVGSAKLGKKGILCTGVGSWLLLAEAPEFQVTKELDVGPRATVPAEHYGDLSTYDLKWGEPRK